jgi:hypothetical protein
MKPSSKITGVLLVAVVGIWGAISYRIYDSLQSDDSAVVGLRQPGYGGSHQLRDTYVYVDDVRDPFRYKSAARRDSVKKQGVAKEKPLLVPPPYKLSGILIADKRKTALLEGADGSAFFLHEGDTLSGVKIMKISDKTVSYAYQKKKMEWILAGSR